MSSTQEFTVLSKALNVIKKCCFLYAIQKTIPYKMNGTCVQCQVWGLKYKRLSSGLKIQSFFSLTGVLKSMSEGFAASLHCMYIATTLQQCMLSGVGATSVLV